MSDEQNVTMSMVPYGMNFSIDVPIKIFASMIHMIGSKVDLGPGKVEQVREGLLAKALEAKNLVELHPELLDEEGFHDGYYMTLCALLLAFDAYLDILPLSPSDQMLDLQAKPANPNYEKFFH